MKKWAPHLTGFLQAHHERQLQTRGLERGGDYGIIGLKNGH